MERNYTDDVRNGYFAWIACDTENIWKNLDRSQEMIRSGKWKEHYAEVVSKYRVSCRFAIMRILFEMTTGLGRTTTNDAALAKDFSVKDIGDFPAITIQHAKSMSDKEVALYRKLLLLRAKENDPDCTEAECFIDSALMLPPEGTKCVLSRDELIRFGHVVNFSLEHMQFLLLRVLGDNEAGFRYSASGDIIDMYGFITHATSKEVDMLKEWYRKQTARVRKVLYADKPALFTQDIADSFEQKISSWPPAEREKKFKDWLIRQAPYLDVKSKSARRVYADLAMYGYLIFGGSRIWISDTFSVFTNNFEDDICKIAYGKKKYGDFHDYTKQLLFCKSKPDLEKCQKMAKILLYENAISARSLNGLEIDEYKDNSYVLRRFYHTPHVESGEISVYGENAMQRVTDILMDRISPNKSDLLFLLWVVANSRWSIEAPRSADKKEEPLDVFSSAQEKAEFLDAFLAAASYVLDAAFLPEFYPPNVLEESMLLSLVLSDAQNPPATVYESICATFTDKGIRKKPHGAKKKTPQQQAEIVAYFKSLRESGKKVGECEQACAEEFGVSVKSVQRYRRLERDGKLNMI